MKEEIGNIDRYRGPKERSLAQCKSNLEAMQTTKEGLESELHQDLMAQLSVTDQAEVDTLNDEIQRLTRENKDAFSIRMRLEGDKNKLEQILTNNLIRRRDELKHALQEISLEDRKHQLNKNQSEVKEAEHNIKQINREIAAVDLKINETNKKLKSELQELDKWKVKEKAAQEKIEEDSKSLEKIAQKQNLLEQKITDCTEKINALGALPAPEMYKKYKEMANSKVS